MKYRNLKETENSRRRIVVRRLGRFGRSRQRFPDGRPAGISSGHLAEAAGIDRLSTSLVGLDPLPLKLLGFLAHLQVGLALLRLTYGLVNLLLVRIHLDESSASKKQKYSDFQIKIFQVLGTMQGKIVNTKV